jgi:endoglucanase
VGRARKLLQIALVGVAVVCTLATPAGAAALAPEAAVRVNQIGYTTVGSKRAYLISSVQEAGAPFTVLRSSDGAVLYSGTVGATLGSWSARFPYVYALDFDALQVPGRYSVSVAGGVPASSPVFALAPAAALYEDPLANALFFYANERDGEGFIPSPLRSAAGHLNDRAAMTYLTPKATGQGIFKGDLHALGTNIDASGGWWDAGDYLKFVQTTSYTVDLLLAGVRDFPAEMGAGSVRSNFTPEAQFGLEWLLRMWDDATQTLYYQVGIGAGNHNTAGDHDIWRLPQADDTYGGEDPQFRYIRHRPVFRAGAPGAPVSPNLAGRDAAAFALCFQVFHSTQPSLAARCLRAAEHIFDLAETHPHGRLLTALPFGFYPEHEWRDDMELGAAELALALSRPGPFPSGLPHAQASFYLSQAAHWAHAYIAHTKGASDPLNLYDVSGLAHYELVQALHANSSPLGLEASEAQLIANLRLQLTTAVRQARSDPFGFGFPWNTADTASHGDGLAVMASEYEHLSGDRSFHEAGAGWLANILGANAWGASLIIGDGTSFPDCPQHQVANLLGSLDGSGPVLAGAVVEGPSNEASAGEVEGMRACPPTGGDPFARFDSSAVFADEVQSYTTVEPAIDLTASSPLAFAWQVELATHSR